MKEEEMNEFANDSGSLKFFSGISIGVFFSAIIVIALIDVCPIFLVGLSICAAVFAGVTWCFVKIGMKNYKTIGYWKYKKGKGEL
ncbi:hypothetical protein KAJ61_00785 [Candidatus Parcubacteria bacterium]|nr:hypothetical protein [Candidatus Parcubacteria bacterium]